MKNWGIKKRVLFLALLPTLLVAISLSFYFSYNRISYIEEALFKKGQSLVSFLAPACEYGVFSGNLEILDRIISKTLDEKDVTSVTIYNAYDEVLITRSNIGNKKHRADSLLSFLTTENQIDFTENITSSEIDIHEFDELFESDIISQDSTVKSIGRIYITLSNLSTRTQQLDSLLKSFLITFAGLIITAFIAIKISKGVIDPIQKLTTAVKQIADGKLNTPISIESGGEIGSLENGVNTMAREIQLVRQDLQIQVDKATAILQKTLDELEIQNIELDLARNQAISASKIKSEFLANMSHEIRTPMNGVLGFTDLLTKTKLSIQQKDYVKTISSSATNLLTIINDILDFSKIESGKLGIENISFNLADVIDDIIAMFAPMAYSKSIELICHPYPKIPIILNGDPTRIRQILVNLIGNAIKFTSKGHVVVRVITSFQNDDRISLKFTIADTGIGMDDTSKKRLFTAFTQADTSISRKFGGTGLGLVISKKLAELMNGDIGFDSAINKGSTFWLTVPLTINNESHNDNTPLTIKDGDSVILFESLTQNRIATRTLLDNIGINTIEASNIEKIPTLLKDVNNGNISAVIAGINRSNINNIYFIKNLSRILTSIGIPYLVIASAFESSELDRISNTGIKNLIPRCSSQLVLRDNIFKTLNPEQNTSSDIYSTEPLPEDISYQWDKIHILLVDDNEINLKLAKTLLENNGIQVTTAHDGNEATELTNINFYDLIFMDLHMPKIDGFQATEQIRQSDNPCNKTTIIALTANALPEEKIRVYDCGMNDILLKPITEKELLNVLSRWLQPSTENADYSEIENDTHTQHANVLETYNEKEGIELAGGNKTLEKELFAMLINELSGHSHEIKKAQKNNDLEELKYHTHKLHGATSYCGVPALRLAAKTLENIIDNSELDELEKAYINTLNAINELVSYYKINFG